MSKKVILFDVEGTLYTKDGVIEGAIELVNRLRKKYAIRFMTNTDSKSQFSVYSHLKKLGFDIQLHEVYTPSRMLHTYLLDKINSAYFLTSQDIKDEFKQKGHLLEDYHHTIYPSHVVMGDIKEVFDYHSINTAFRYVEKGAQLIVLQEGLFYLTGDEINIDTGSFAKIFSREAQENKILVGKPSPIFLSAIMDELNINDKEDFLIVGDDIFSDIAMGNQLGVETVLVQTGKYELQKGLSHSIQPDYLLESVSTLHKLLQEL